MGSMRQKNHGTDKLIWPQGNIHYSPLISHLRNRKPEEKNPGPRSTVSWSRPGRPSPGLLTAIICCMFRKWQPRGSAEESHLKCQP